MRLSELEVELGLKRYECPVNIGELPLFVVLVDGSTNLDAIDYRLDVEGVSVEYSDVDTKHVLDKPYVYVPNQALTRLENGDYEVMETLAKFMNLDGEV